MKPEELDRINRAEAIQIYTENRCEALEKENAELKKWQKDTIKARGNDYMDWSRMKDQLTEAKEIIKDLLSLKSSISAEEVRKRFSVRERAEAFLKEE